jgi:hypothetical protein
MNVPDWLLKKTFCAEYSPNCVWLVRLPGKSAVIDKRSHIKNETGDALGFGVTLEEAANAALEHQRVLKSPSAQKYPPAFPHGSLRYESDLFTDKCVLCDSSLARKWFFFKAKGCIQPECPNYHVK